MPHLPGSLLRAATRKKSTRSTSDCTAEHEAVAFAALLPLVRNNADIAHLVMKYYQWAVLVQKVRDLQQEYDKIISDAEYTLSQVPQQHDMCSIYAASINDLDDRYDRDMYERVQEHYGVLLHPLGEVSCEMYSHVVAVELYLLKQEVALCQRFEHPDTARRIRKLHGAEMATRIKKLL